MANQRIEFGDRVKDIISGFTGICTGKAQFITGCSQILINGSASDSKTDSYWYDEQRVCIVKKNAVTLPNPAEPTRAPIGGPQHTPANRKMPR